MRLRLRVTVTVTVRVRVRFRVTVTVRVRVGVRVRVRLLQHLWAEVRLEGEAGGAGHVARQLAEEVLRAVR